MGSGSWRSMISRYKAFARSANTALIKGFQVLGGMGLVSFLLIPFFYLCVPIHTTSTIFRHFIEKYKGRASNRSLFLFYKPINDYICI